MSPYFHRQNRLSSNAREIGAGVSRAFTLIELLVVVGIIGLLAAILIPSLARLKNGSRGTQTQAIMMQISHSIDSYYGMFNAYPGPIATYSAAVASTAGDGTKVMSGSQNLLLGLTYGMNTTGGVQIPGCTLPPSGSQAYSDPSRATGPINYAALQPSGNYEQLPAYFTPQPQQLSLRVAPGTNSWPGGGVANSTGTFAFPVLVDAFPDGLPILYYRRSPGIDTPVVSTNPNAAAAYYLAENQEYTGATQLTATNGEPIQQSTDSPANPHDPPRTALDALGLQQLIDPLANAAALSTSPPYIPKVRGGYMLMSAGPDRYYGYTGSPGHTSCDNIVVIGGN